MGGILVSPGWAARPPVSGRQAHQQKRGPLAWENYVSSPLMGLHSGGTTRLLVHALADSSNQAWLPKVRAFLTWVRDKQLPFHLRKGH